MGATLMGLRHLVTPLRSFCDAMCSSLPKRQSRAAAIRSEFRRESRALEGLGSPLRAFSLLPHDPASWPDLRSINDLAARIVGTAAALCFISSFAPQMIKIWKEKDASSISLKTYSLTVTCSVLWVA
jgi:hypothetical protein